VSSYDACVRVMGTSRYFVKIKINYPLVEACLNTSTITLRVLGGGEKRTPYLGVYLGHLVIWGT
jgi:hypothetical protein